MRRLLLVVMAVACAHTPPPRPVYGSTGRRTPAGYCDRDAVGRLPDGTPLPGPALAELAALVGDHSPAGPPPALDASGALALPVDWRTLPLTAELWSAPLLGHALLVDRVVLGYGGGAVRVALDLETGAERFRVDVPERDAEFFAGCGHIVRVTPEEAVAFDAETGATVWRRGLRSEHVRLSPERGAVVQLGCRLVYQLDDYGAAPDDPFRSRELWVLDVRSGDAERFGSCAPRASITATSDGAIVVDGRALELPGLEPEATPTPGRVEAMSAIEHVEGVLVGRGADGAEAWRRSITTDRDPPWAVVLARPDGDAVVLDGTALVRVSRTTGLDVWRLPLSPELATAVSGVDGHASNERHIVIGSRSEPRILLDIEPSTGAVSSLRISSVDPVGITLVGDLALVAGHGGTGAVVDLRLEAPPIRSRLSLEDDVARALAVLGARGPYGSPGVDTCPWAYPADGRDAIEWLGRLGPLVGDVVSGRVTELPVGAASNLLSALSGQAATSAALGVLRRTYDAPDAVAASARARACDALISPVSDEDANALLDATLESLDTARASGTRNYRGWDDAWRPVVACRDALGRVATEAVLAQWDDAIAIRATTRVADTCEPSEEDAVRGAVLRFWFELQDASSFTVAAPGAGCITVQTLDGPLHVSVDEDPPRPRFVVGPPHDIGEGERALLPWPDAPARRVWAELSSGHSEGNAYVVQYVEGRWRVVREEEGFTS